MESGYCSFELSKLLKERGFDEPCDVEAFVMTIEELPKCLCRGISSDTYNDGIEKGLKYYLNNLIELFMAHEEHINHFKNWYINHKSYSKWQKQLNAYKLDNEDIVLIYAKETMAIKTDKETIDYWTSEFVCEDILE